MRIEKVGDAMQGNGCFTGTCHSLYNEYAGVFVMDGVNDCRAFSFYRKIGLLDKLNVTDRNKLEKVVVALTQINTLRNRLAHEVLFSVDNSDFSYWAIEVLANFNGAKFTKYTYRTKIIHAFSVLSKNILVLDQSIKQ